MTARWIKLREATKYAAVGKARLISLAMSGVVRGAKDPDSKCGDWIFDRLSLDKYTDALTALVDDTGGWLSWYCWDNSMGKKAHTAKAPSWKKFKKVKTLKDLCKIMEADI